MPTTYVQRSTASDLSGGGEYSLQLLEGAVAEVTRDVQLAASQTKTGHHFTASGIPGASGVTGNYTVEVFIAVGDNQVQVSAAVARVNSAGTQQSTSAFSAEQTASGAVLTFNFSNVNLGTWASGDRLRIATRYRNSHSKTSRTVTVSFNTTSSEVVAPWTIGSTVSLSGSGANASDGSGDLTVSSPAVDLSGSGANAADGSGAVSVTRRLSGSGANASDGSGGPLTTAYYAIFRRTPQTGGVFDPDVDTPIDTTTATSYLDENLADGGYDYQVFHWDTAWSSGSNVEQATVSTGGTVTLSGSGANAADGSGTLGATREISGSGANASDGAGTLDPIRGLTGSGANASTGSGVLSVGGEVTLTGSGANASTGSGALSVDVSLSGSGANASDGQASIDVTRGLSGAGDNASAGTADASITRGLSGSGANAATGSGQLSAGGEVFLSGSGANAATGTGALDVDLALSGSGANASVGTGALDLGVDLSGAGANASTGLGDLTVSGQNIVALSGSGANASAGSGAVDLTRGLTGTGANAATGQGSLDLTVDLAGAGPAAMSGFGVLAALRALSGAGANASAGSAVLGVGTPGFVRVEASAAVGTLIDSESAVITLESAGLVGSGIEGA